MGFGQPLAQNVRQKARLSHIVTGLKTATALLPDRLERFLNCLALRSLFYRVLTTPLERMHIVPGQNWRLCVIVLSELLSSIHASCWNAFH